MQHTCTQCNQAFDPSASTGFYTKLGVPTPTLCPSCRKQRRMAFRNERNLYRRECGMCSRSLISIYSPDKPFRVFCNSCYRGDGWDPMSYGREYDFSKPFFQQLKELQHDVPRLYAFTFQNVDSEYVNGAAFNKNCYLIFVSDHNEDCMYSYGIMNCNECVDCYGCLDCELCYECIDCTNCYGTIFSVDCSDSQDLLFCKNCSSCQDCIGCVNLKNKKYHIFNEPYTREEYLAKKQELGFDTANGLQDGMTALTEYTQSFPSKYLHGVANIEVTGDYVDHSKQSFDVFDSSNLEDCRFINHGHKIAMCQDSYVIIDKSQFSYEVVSGISLNNVLMSYCVWNTTDATYCDTCENSNNLFGCVGLNKKSYCILNKQYSKEDYEALVIKIKNHMKIMPYVSEDGKPYIYGEYFPYELSPFAYNETVAQEYYPSDEQAVREFGSSWKTKEDRDYQITIEARHHLLSHDEIPDSITGEIIECLHQGTCGDDCTRAFRITQSELQFYKKRKLPLPRLCPNCRHMRRFTTRNTQTLTERRCMCDYETYTNSSKHSNHSMEQCPNTFTTTYAEDDPSIVYCEECYQQEVS